MFFYKVTKYKHIPAATLVYGIIGSLLISSAMGMLFFDGHSHLGLDQEIVASKKPIKKAGLKSEQASQAPEQVAISSNQAKQTVNINYNNLPEDKPQSGNQNVYQRPVVKPAAVSSGPIPERDYPMLARIIHAEAGGESLRGQVAVGAVLINRINSGKFPRSLNANIFKPGEFESVSNGYIWSEPNPESYKAARLAMNGWDPTYGALYFFNPAKSSSRWIWSRPVTIIIGQHYFAG